MEGGYKIPLRNFKRRSGVLLFIFAVIGYGIYWPFFYQPSMWATGINSCEFWHLLSVFLILIIFTVLLITVGRWYKNRNRENVLPNEHIFAERYYENISHQ